MGLAGRGTDAKLEQPGAQQVEPVPGTASPTQGERAWQRLPARGTQPVPAWLPWLPTFPRCHPSLPLPPMSGPGQCPGLLAEGMTFPCHLWVPRFLWYLIMSNQEASGRVIRTPKCRPPLSGLFQSWGTWDTQTRYLPTAPSHWDKMSACGARGSVGVPPAPVLDSLEEGLRNWVAAGPLHSC